MYLTILCTNSLTQNALCSRTSAGHWPNCSDSGIRGDIYIGRWNKFERQFYQQEMNILTIQNNITTWRLTYLHTTLGTPNTEVNPVMDLKKMNKIISTFVPTLRSWQLTVLTHHWAYHCTIRMYVHVLSLLLFLLYIF